MLSAYASGFTIISVKGDSKSTDKLAQIQTFLKWGLPSWIMIVSESFWEY